MHGRFLLSVWSGVDVVADGAGGRRSGATGDEYGADGDAEGQSGDSEGNGRQRPGVVVALGRGGGCRRGRAGTRGRPCGGAVRRRECHSRSRLLGVRRAEPADDLTALVGLERLEGQLAAGRALRDRKREPEVLELAGTDDPAARRVADPGDGRDLLVDFEGGDVVRVWEPLPLDHRLPSRYRLVGDEREARRHLDLDSDRPLVVALVGDTEVEPREAPGRSAAGL